MSPVGSRASRRDWDSAFSLAGRGGERFGGLVNMKSEKKLGKTKQFSERKLLNSVESGNVIIILKMKSFQLPFPEEAEGKM